MKKVAILTIAVALGCLFASTSVAVQYQMEHTYTAMTPIFMVGHVGDPAKIEGFEIHSTVALGGQVIGSALTRVRLLAPPMDITVPISWMNADVTYTFEGLGTIEVHSVGISYGTSNAAATGEIVFAGAGSVRNGTGRIAGLEGVASSYGNTNIFIGGGNETVVFDIP